MKRSRVGDERCVRDLLLAVVSHDHDAGEIGSLISSVDADTLIVAARRHHVVSLLHERLRSIDGNPSEVADVVGGARLAAQAHRLQLLQGMGLALDALDVPSLTIKGQVLATHWYRDPTARDFNDIDIVVRPEDFERAVSALTAADFAPAATNWHGFLEHAVAEVPMRLKRTVIDLHWHVVALGMDRRHVHVPTSELFDHAETVRIGELDVLTLCPVDTLLHLCINTGLGGARRLRGLVDIDVVLHSGRVDLDAFAARAHRAGAGRLCSAILQRVSTVVGTRLPHGLLNELSPSRSWLFVNRAIDRVSLGRRSSSSVTSGLVLSSGRDTGPATAAAFVRAARRALATRRGQPGLADEGGALDWTRVPDDGDVDTHRRAYFDWVASAASSGADGLADGAANSATPSVLG